MSSSAVLPFEICSGLDITTIHELDSCIHAIPNEALARSQAVVVKIAPGLLQTLKAATQSKYRTLAARSVSADLYFITFSPKDYQIELYTLRRTSSNVTLERIEDVELCREIRKQEIGRLIETGKKLSLHKNEGFVFLSPSGSLCEDFFRCANLLNSAEHIDILAFWSLPYLHQKTAILLDTWSISAVAFRMLQLAEMSIPVQGFEIHPSHDSVNAGKVVQNIEDRVAEGASILCLTSVGSTGKYQSIVEKLFRDAPASITAKVSYLFCLSDSSPEIKDDSLGVIEDISSFSNADQFLDRKRVTIDPVLFYPRVWPETTVQVKPAHFGLKYDASVKEGMWEELRGSDQRSCIDLYDRVPDAIQVHRDFEDRHFPFFIDIGVLATSESWINKALTLPTMQGRQFDLVVTAGFEPSITLGSRIAKQLGLPVKMIELARGSDIKDKKILFVREGLSSGDTLITDSVQIRTLATSHNNPASVDYLVGLACTSDPEIDSVQSAIGRGNSWKVQLHVVDRIPFSTELACPWCEEARVLEKVIESSPEAEDDCGGRLQLLRRKLISGWDIAGGSVTDSRLSVSQGSKVFPAGWSAIAAQLYISNALQNLRMAEPSSARLSAQYYSPQVLSWNTVQRYNDELLEALFIRAVERHEWGGTNQALLLRRLFRQLSTRSDWNILPYEVLLMFARGLVTPENRILYSRHLTALSVRQRAYSPIVNRVLEYVLAS
ncbi:MAG: hypothetical protein WCK51_06270 [Armatimonadota bacterium]